MYKLKIPKICFEFAPEQVLNELKALIENDGKNGKENKQYIINFYENKETFIIDISGTLEFEKISALKLMFLNYLGQARLKKIRGVVYIFNNTDETSMNFLNTWTLFRFWESLGIKFGQVYYLSSSEPVIKNVTNYLESFGVKHSHNLLEIVQELYPELQKAEEEKVFEFASTLLQTVK